MQINEPVVSIVMEGNVKEKVSKISYTYLASYEALKNETCIVVKVPLVIKNEQKGIEKSVKQHYAKYGKVKTTNYYKDGMDFIQMVSNN